MIFSAELLPRVLDGTKTQTRRFFKNSTQYWSGQSIAVQPGRGQNAVARINITSTTIQDLSDITQADAQAEGFATTLDFYDKWVELYKIWEPDKAVWKLEFVLEHPE